VTASLSERLDQMVKLYVAPWRDAGHSEPYPYFTLGNPATDAELDELERAIGRLLPTEARDVYKWHNGCIVWLVPGIGFRNMRLARSIYDITKKQEFVPPLSNGAELLEASELFEIFNVDKPSLCVRTTVDERIPASPVYFLDPEMDQFTMVAKSISDLVDRFIRELEAGHVQLTEHGIMWTSEAGAFSFFRSMAPYGG
jgi:hypothetical protein